MTYFAVYMLKGLIVDVCSFDTQDARDESIKYFGNLSEYQQPFKFDSILPFDQVS